VTKSFLLVWMGQAISFFGWALTRFGLGVWVFQQTGSATRFALILLFATLPEVLLLPFAGSLADRWDRRHSMLLGVTGSAACVLVLGVLLSFERLAFWQIYLLLALRALFSTIHWPAFAASISLLVPPNQLPRANGMVQLAAASAQVIAPLAAGGLLERVGLRPLVWLDLGAHVLAFATLLIATFRPVPPTEIAHAHGNVLDDLRLGWTYIASRPGLLGLLVFSLVNNFSMGMLEALITPLLLSFASPASLGLVMSVGGLGMVAGSIVMSLWGGPRRHIHGVLGSTLGKALVVCVMGLQRSEPLIAGATFAFLFLVPIAEGANQSLWQKKVAPAVQGRVFALRRAIGGGLAPLAFILAGPLVDRVFEPLLLPGGLLAPTLGEILGVGRGRGTALLLVLVGAIAGLVAIAGYLQPRLRHIEEELPDALV